MNRARTISQLSWQAWALLAAIGLSGTTANASLCEYILNLFRKSEPVRLMIKANVGEWQNLYLHSPEMEKGESTPRWFADYALPSADFTGLNKNKLIRVTRIAEVPNPSTPGRPGYILLVTTGLDESECDKAAAQIASSIGRSALSQIAIADKITDHLNEWNTIREQLGEIYASHAATRSIER